MCMKSNDEQPVCGWIIPPRIGDFVTYVFRVLPTGRLIPGKVAIGGNSLAFTAMDTQSYKYASLSHPSHSHTSLLNLYCVDCATMHSSLEEPRFHYDELIILRALGVAPDDATLAVLSTELKTSKTHSKQVTTSNVNNRSLGSPINLYHCFGTITSRLSKKAKYRVLSLSFLRKIISYRSSYLLQDNMKVKANKFLSSPVLVERFSQLLVPKDGVHRFIKLRLYDESVLIFFGLPRKIDALMNQLNKTMLTSHSLQARKRISHWDPPAFTQMNYFPELYNGTDANPVGSKDNVRKPQSKAPASEFSIAIGRCEPSLPPNKSMSTIVVSPSAENMYEYESSQQKSTTVFPQVGVSHDRPHSTQTKRVQFPQGFIEDPTPITSNMGIGADRFKISLFSHADTQDLTLVNKNSFSIRHNISDTPTQHSSLHESESSDTITEDSAHTGFSEHSNYISSSGTEDFSMYVYEPCLNVDSEILRRKCRKFRRKKPITMAVRKRAVVQADSASILSYMTSKTEKTVKRSLYDKKYTSPTKTLWNNVSSQAYSNLKAFCVSSRSREKQFFKSHDSKLWIAPEEDVAKHRAKNKDLSDSDLIIDLPVVSLLPTMPSKHLRRSFSKENLESLRHGIESLNDMLKQDNIIVDSEVMQTVYNTRRRKRMAPVIPTNRNAQGIASIEHQILERGLADAIRECMDAIALQVTNSDMRKSLELERMRRGSLEYVQDISPNCEQSSSNDQGEEENSHREMASIFSQDLLYLSLSDERGLEPLSTAFGSHGLPTNSSHPEKTSQFLSIFKKRSNIAPSFIIKNLIEHMPSRYNLMGTNIGKYKLVVIYDMRTDGRHLSHLYAAIKRYIWGDSYPAAPGETHKLIYDSASLLLIQTTDMQVCGVFMMQPPGLIGIPNGTSDNFVFSYPARISMQSSNQLLKIYHSTGKNTIFQVKQEEMLTFGAGGGSAIVVQADMYYVQTGQSETYGNDFLFEGENFPRFKRQQVLNIELLSFVKCKSK